MTAALDDERGKQPQSHPSSAPGDVRVRVDDPDNAVERISYGELPQRDASKSNQEQGVYQKYQVEPLPIGGHARWFSEGMIREMRLPAGAVIVSRTDNKPISWCFILQDSDPLAVQALMVYAALADDAGYHALADDLREQTQRMVNTLGDAVPHVAIEITNLDVVKKERGHETAGQQEPPVPLREVTERE